MCVRYCALHPDLGCDCEVHEHTAVLEIYDMDFNGQINREEFNALVDEAEAGTIPWTYYIYNEGF